MPSETIERYTTQFVSNREKFEAFCRSLSEEELERPVPDSHWRVKDFITHLATMDTILSEQMDALAGGGNQVLGGAGDKFDVDAWNEAEIHERRDWTLDQILGEAAQNRERFLASLSKLTDEQIEQTMHFTGDNKRDPADVQYKLFLGGLARHDPIHAADMVKALPERADDPVIKDWLNDSIVQWYQTTMAGPARR
jgi:hypothetical protein